MILVVMGVSGCGKTTVAGLIAERLSCPFQEGDALHSPENVAKMSRGTPLTDADRLPWLERIAGVIDGWRATGGAGVVTCSALKRRYRDVLVGGRPDVVLVHLAGTIELVRDRMAARQNHFMPLGLLDSQFAALEPPGPDERPVTVDIGGTPAEIVAATLRALAERS